MNRILVVTLRVPDDLALAKYAVMAAHSEPAATIVVDLGASEPTLGDLDDLLDEFERTARGNGQRLVLLAPAARLERVAPRAAARSRDLAEAGAGAELGRADDLDACLEALFPPAPGAFAVELTLPARLEFLAPLRRYLSSVVRALHGEADAFHVEILVDELCLNAVENSPSDRISYDLAFACEGDELRVDVTNVFDDSLNSERIMHRRLQSFDDSGDYLGERGRGLFLIARIADGLQIRSVDHDRIRVSVTKRLGRGEVEMGPLPPRRRAERARS